MANTDYGFRDMRNAAELMLSPGRPKSLSLVDIGSVKLDIGAAIKVPGAISEASQLTGAVRDTFSGVLQMKKITTTLSTSLSTTLSQFQNKIGTVGTTLNLPHALGSVSVEGIPSADDFFRFSNLKPGETIPSSFKAMVAERKAQLQALTARVSSAMSAAAMGGVSITENYAKTPYPLDTELDLPTIPRLAQGGDAAASDPIIGAKSRFVVAGVSIGAGKPSLWSRLVSAAAVKASPMLNPTVNQLFRDRKNQSAWSEPPSPYAAQFPYNKVQQTESGHVIELDDTPGAERVHIFHRSGSFVEFHPNGTVVYKNMKDGYLLTMNDQFVKVSGACHITVEGKATLYAKDSLDVQSDGDINFNAKGDFNVFAQNCNLRAKQTFKGDGMMIDLRYINLPSQIAPVVPGILVPVVNIANLKADFPSTGDGGSSNIDEVLEAFAQNPVDVRTCPKLVLTPAESLRLPENPLANPTVYGKQTVQAVNYRARLFDAPEEVGNMQLYMAHVGLQSSLGDTTEDADPRELAGALSAVVAANTTVEKPAINYLNFDDFKGHFGYADDYVLANTSFRLSDVVDLALYPEICTPPDLPLGGLPSSSSSRKPGGSSGGAGGGGTGGGGRTPGGGGRA